MWLCGTLILGFNLHETPFGMLNFLVTLSPASVLFLGFCCCRFLFLGPQNMRILFDKPWKADTISFSLCVYERHI